jgi:hypothetical protein
VVRVVRVISSACAQPLISRHRTVNRHRSEKRRTPLL